MMDRTGRALAGGPLLLCRPDTREVHSLARNTGCDALTKRPPSISDTPVISLSVIQHLEALKFILTVSEETRSGCVAAHTGYWYALCVAFVVAPLRYRDKNTGLLKTARNLIWRMFK